MKFLYFLLDILLLNSIKEALLLILVVESIWHMEYSLVRLFLISCLFSCKTIFCMIIKVAINLLRIWLSFKNEHWTGHSYVDNILIVAQHLNYSTSRHSPTNDSIIVVHESQLYIEYLKLFGCDYQMSFNKTNPRS